MNLPIHPDWRKLLKEEFEKEYFKNLEVFLRAEYAQKTVFPPKSDIFKAFDMVPPKEIKVVIIGQDPYHGEGMAHGLCFSVPKEIPIPKSLKNIYKEIQEDIGIVPPQHGNLESWAQQGVFLLNASLTVVSGKPLSHQNSGWLTFTDKVIQIISENFENVVFLLWGNFAKQKKALINTQKHLILEAAHPSPLAARRGFFGCKHFSKANAYLTSKNLAPINW